jgi:hypothetical protein
MKPTQEQQLIIDSARQRQNLAITAFAGAAKTTTCSMIAKELTRPSLYIAFNKSIATEASEKFPIHVDCKTLHSLAYADIITPNKMFKKVSGFVDTKEVISLLDKQLELYTDVEVLEIVYQVIDVIKYFCQSAEFSLEEFSDVYLSEKFNSEDRAFYRSLVVQVWSAMTSKVTTMKMTHDVYLKLFQLSKPTLDRYEVIYLDECLTGDSLVKTNLGLRSIKSLYNSYSKGKDLPQVLSYNILKEYYEYKPILNAIRSFNRDILLVETEGLNKVKCTPNHPLLTQRGYVRADELITGKDYLLLDNVDNQKAKYVLNSDQYQLVLGSFLGDGHLAKQSDFNTFRLKLTQGVKQENYLRHKADILSIDTIHTGVSGYTGESTILNAQSKVFILEKGIWESLKDLDARGLAIWYMDDGSLGNSNNVTLHSNSFTYKEHLVLQDILLQNFELKATICNSKGFYYFNFNQEEGIKFLNLIKNYMHPDLNYKTTLTREFSYVWDREFKPYAGNFVSSVTPIGIDTVYDIEVADNHNFITTRTRCPKASGVIVHNCQDSNPVSLDIFYRQTHAQLVMAGDPYQSIYEWRGAINAFESVPTSFVRKELTESFRFTQEIANLASKLTYIAGNDIRITGLATKGEIVSKAVICRTNASILARLLSAVQNKNKVFVLADLQDLWSKMYHISALVGGAKPRYPNKSLVGFHSFDELKREAEHSAELRRLLNLSSILASGKGTHANIVSIKEVIVEDASDADFTISTCHKSKGLEWDFVELDDDMLDLEEEERPLVEVLKEGQTLNLLYVTITRAKYKLLLPSSISEVLRQAENLRAGW